MMVYVSGDVSPKKARPGRRKGLRNTHSIGAIYPQELWIERTEGEARFVPEVVGGDERENSVRALDPTGAQGQGSMFKPVGWGGLHPGREERGPGQVAGQRPGNLDTCMCTQLGVGRER